MLMVDEVRIYITDVDDSPKAKTDKLVTNGESSQKLIGVMLRKIRKRGKE